MKASGTAQARGSSVATGGTGGLGQDGAQAVASVRAVTDDGTAIASVRQQGGHGGGSSTVALGGNGADSQLADAVTGSTTGRLELDQYAYGGDGGSGQQGGDGGAASSTLDVVHSGSDLEVDARAFAGDGGRSFGAGNDDGVDGSAYASARGESAGNVSVRAEASGDDATLGPVYGKSTTGGTVDVTAVLRSSGTQDLVLDNAVDGDTTGVLALGQTAYGGDGASATSRIDRSGTWSQIRTDAQARGTALSSTGGDMHVENHVENLGGSVLVTGTAQAWAGGDASVDLSGTTHGDGNSVSVGNSSSASGGPGVSAHPDGGNGSMNAVGTALGDSVVSVSARGLGGRGGTNGLGGDAEARAEGSNQGASQVTVTASATGGDGGGVAGDGGTATASAHGESTTGVVRVNVDQTGGRGGSGGSSVAGGTGGDSVLVNAATGSTAGRLTLDQTAVGGTGGSGSTGGDGGSASSTLDATHTGSGLSLTADAWGGLGGSSFSGNPRGAEGTAFASARGESAGDVDVTVLARGDASLGEVFGHSTDGGRVRSTATLRQTAAGDLLLDNVADGMTTGRLELRQTARQLDGARVVPHFGKQ